MKLRKKDEVDHRNQGSIKRYAMVIWKLESKEDWRQLRKSRDVK